MWDVAPAVKVRMPLLMPVLSTQTVQQLKRQCLLAHPVTAAPALCALMLQQRVTTSLSLHAALVSAPVKPHRQAPRGTAAVPPCTRSFHAVLVVVPGWSGGYSCTILQLLTVSNSANSCSATGASGLAVQCSHLALQALQTLLAAAVVKPHPAPLARAYAALLAAVAVVAALAAVAHQELTGVAFAACAATPRPRQQAPLAWPLI